MTKSEFTAIYPNFYYLPKEQQIDFIRSARRSAFHDLKWTIVASILALCLCLALGLIMAFLYESLDFSKTIPLIFGWVAFVLGRRILAELTKWEHLATLVELEIPQSNRDLEISLQASQRATKLQWPYVFAAVLSLPIYIISHPFFVFFSLSMLHNLNLSLGRFFWFFPIPFALTIFGIGAYGTAKSCPPVVSRWLIFIQFVIYVMLFYTLTGLGAMMDAMSR